MDYLLTEEQKMIKELAHKIAEEKIRPVAAKYDESEEYPWDVVKVMAQSDLFSIFVPSEYGGTGSGVLELCLVTEELSRACGGIAVCYAASALGTFPIVLFGNDEQKKKYLPDLASGKKVAAFGITEPEAGSDASAIKTTAKKEGDHYILNGLKHFITNGGDAETYVVIAMTDKTKGARGASAFIVEKGMPGFTFGKKEEKLGIRASSTRELIFTDCKVPKENLLAKEGMGFIVTMRTFDMSRPGVAAQALGIAQGSLEVAVKYAKERQQFGKSISSFQGIQWMLADMATTDRSGPRPCLCLRERNRCRRKRRCPRFCHGQDVRLGCGDEGHHGCRPDFGRLRLHERISGGKIHARCQDYPDLRRHEPGAKRTLSHCN